MVEGNVFSFICFRLSQQEGLTPYFIWMPMLYVKDLCKIFYSLILTEKIAAVVKDVDSIQNKVNERLSAFNLQGGYFNSGVVFC
ncbi:lipopolysaccharide 1,2-glucosyltransferase [Salmonella enterica subsp. enterica]|uniref:Lipopolysaccharide 1,2-glucosyltransferase n=1 Tax=Salmonella enterica I TaxID=59201 RepID=A0A447TSI2_SALET|nr:lipopolysaccharide 1,2-glucosyltransferase [Salmonella enterica subsp. enterica]